MISDLVVLALLAAPMAVGLSAGANAATGQFADIQIGEMQSIVSDFRYQGVFGGLVGEPSTGVVTIFLAPSPNTTESGSARAALAVIGTSSDPKIEYSPKRWSVRFQTAGPSLKVLNETMRKIETSEPWRTNVGKTLVSYGVDQARHVVSVGVEAITPNLISDSVAAFGNLVQVHTEKRPALDLQDCEFAPSPKPPRCLDSQPYYGGDRVATSNPFNECTGGFEAWDPGAGGNYGMLTAGHCWDVGTIVAQGYTDQVNYPYPWYVPTSGTMGKVTRRLWADNVTDAEFLDASSVGTSLAAARVYTTTPTGSASSFVSDYGMSFVGMQQICTDGSVTGEICSGNTIQQIQQCIYPAQYRVCHETKISSSQTVCNPGDSGGPVYNYSGGRIVAYGLIESGNCYFSEITQVLAQLGVGLVTVNGNLTPPKNLGDTLWPNQAMHTDQYIGSCSTTSSCANTYIAIMQGDGNFVVYLQTPSGSQAQWWTGTGGNPGDWVIMGGDGNLVVYKSDGIHYDWNSRTQNNPGACLIMQPDGNLVIYSQTRGAFCGQGATPIWWTRH
jgi:hypothetical protein